MTGFWDAVASAGPYANNLHLAPDRQTHLITQFLQAGYSSGRPSNSVKALNDILLVLLVTVTLFEHICMHCNLWP